MNDGVNAKVRTNAVLRVFGCRKCDLIKTARRVFVFYSCWTTMDL